MINNNYVDRINLPNKDDYLFDIIYLQCGTSTAEVFPLSITFINESVQMIKNAIELFDCGYFDSAYYSLRSAIDISYTILFFSEKSTQERDKILRSWRNKDAFPDFKQLRKFLEENAGRYNDLKNHMTKMFGRLGKLHYELNKHVHKQGFANFYVSHKTFTNQQKESFIKTFVEHLEQCIATVAILNLALDPFPMLLRDPEIDYRVDVLANPFSDAFIKKYLTEYEIKKFLETDLYIRTRLDIIQQFEKMTEGVYWLNKHYYICPSLKNDVIKQSHLVNNENKIKWKISEVSEKIIAIKCETDIRPTLIEGRCKNPNNFILVENTIATKRDSFQYFNKLRGSYYCSNVLISSKLFCLLHADVLSDEEIKMLKVIS